MWIVRLALRRPYTVAVMAMLILVLGGLSLSRMQVDILPNIDIPVVIVVWNYPGLSPEDMEGRIVLISERAYSTTVNGIERIESQSIPGIGIIKVYFHQGTDIGAAIAQIASVSSTVLRSAPPGLQPPQIIQFNASNVPVAQLTLSSKTLPEEQIFDYGLNFIRVSLFVIPGLSTPAPFGGKQRQVMIEIDPARLSSRGLSAGDVVNALKASNVIFPAGMARMGDREYNVLLNSSPTLLDQFKQIPLKVVGNAVVYLSDVASVIDGYAEQENIVRVNSRRATYLAILKHSDASTLAVVNATKEMMPSIKAAAPEGLDIKMDFDQSIFVRGAISGVLREAVMASMLVSLMILIFLGSWRSMLIVIMSIPLAILTSVIGLKLWGFTINIMTLGGLALAIGMLVDDATVEIENIHRNRAMGKTMTIAVLDGARQVAMPAIVATSAVCVVFFPVVLLQGPAQFLFSPLALAVVIAMFASYILSRTLVPTLARMILKNEHHTEGESHEEDNVERGPIGRVIHRLDLIRIRFFDRLQSGYTKILTGALRHRAFTLVIAGSILIISLGLLNIIGTDFFPSVDAGMMKLHFRAPSGTRVEETERMVAQIEQKIREIIPPDEVSTINSMIGLPLYYNLAFVQTDNVGSMDAEILVALNPGHKPTMEYRKKIREILAHDFPGSQCYFQAADIVTQVLNFGLAAPIDIQIRGRDFDQTFPYVTRIENEVKKIPGAADVHISQVLDYPTLQVDVDRSRAARVGMSQNDVANSVLIALSSSSLIAPSFFLNPVNHVNYTVAVQVPFQEIHSVGSLAAIALTPPSSGTLLQPASQPAPTSVPSIPAQTLANVSTIYHRNTPGNINHYTVQRVLDVNASVEGRDLGSVARDIQKVIDGLGKLPAGINILLLGQNEIMTQSFRSLGLGLILAVVLVYLLMVVLYQSWLDPFIIMMAVPGALVGILWMLAFTGTTINVESLMGAIMAIGVGTANSILLVSFANDIRFEKDVTPIQAALEAGKTRLRPVLMTALAMIIGMIPMALGLGEAGEQNAPLGRAVIGGLLVATVMTLLVVPVVYSILRTALPTKHLLEERFLAEERGETAE